MNKSNLIFGLVIVLVVGGIVYATAPKQTSINNSGKETSISSSSQAMVEKDSAKSSSELMTKNIKEINMEAGSFYYKPNTITVKKGETVKIVMHSVSMMHDFNIDELNVRMPIVKNGDTGTVEFTADKVGTFEYYCSVGQHRANGQVGKITIN